MTAQELFQRHLDFAVGDARLWFRNMPRLTHQFICQRLVDSITQQFRGHEVILFHFELSRTAEDVYEIRVNQGAYVKLVIGKEVHDE